MHGRIRVLVAKPGLDGHDQGAKIVVRALMDAGFEVIYTGLRQTPDAVARISLEEDVDVIALSSMAGSHLPVCKKLKPLLEADGLADKLWLIGGSLPQPDHAAAFGDPAHRLCSLRFQSPPQCLPSYRTCAAGRVTS